MYYCRFTAAQKASDFRFANLVPNRLHYWDSKVWKTQVMSAVFLSLFDIWYCLTMPCRTCSQNNPCNVVAKWWNIHDFVRSHSWVKTSSFFCLSWILPKDSCRSVVEDGLGLKSNFQVILKQSRKINQPIIKLVCLYCMTSVYICHKSFQFLYSLSQASSRACS